VATRFLDSVRGRSPRVIVLLVLLLLALPGPLAAQDSSWGLSLAPVDDLSLSPTERSDSKRPCPEYRLLPGDPRDCEPWVASADLTPGVPLRVALADADLPATVEARQPNRLVGTILPLTSIGLVAANSLLGYDGQDFHATNERMFQADTRDGGADKASHFADYYIVAKEVAFVYEKIGYSENAARWWGFGVAVSTGLANRFADGFTSTASLARPQDGCGRGRDAVWSRLRVPRTSSESGRRTSPAPRIRTTSTRPI
jgi:hypothetical protein